MTETSLVLSFPNWKQLLISSVHEDWFLQSSIVSGNFLPPVSGNPKVIVADIKALVANMRYGITTLVSANSPTYIEVTPPILAMKEHDPTPAFLSC